MHLEDRIKNGMTFYEHGHTDPIDIEQEKELEDAYQLKILNLRLRLEAIKMRPAEREVVQNELNQVQSEREQQRQ